MDFIAAIIAGIVGTLAMTIIMVLAPMMGMPKMDIIGMLGSMFTANPNTARVIGVIEHFMMGIIFALIYAFLWSVGVGSPTWAWGLIFGLIHGILVAVMMPIMNRMHPRPQEMSAGAMMVVGLLMGHAVFGLGVALTYGAIA